MTVDNLIRNRSRSTSHIDPTRHETVSIPKPNDDTHEEKRTVGLKAWQRRLHELQSKPLTGCACLGDEFEEKPEHRQAILTVSTILADIPDMGFYDIVIGFRLYSRMQVFDFAKPNNLSKPEPNLIAHELRYFMAHSWAVYYAPNLERMSLDSQCPEESFVTSDYPSLPFHPAYYLCVDHDRKILVISIRGTWDVGDMLTTLASIPKPIPSDWKLPANGYAHEGVLKSVNNTWERLREPLKETIKLYPNYKVVVTGHSLGGAVAGLLTIYMKYSGISGLDDTRCVVFGPPPSLRGEILEYCDEFMLVLVNGYDFVPRMSVPALLYLMQVSAYAMDLPCWERALLFCHADSFMDFPNVPLPGPSKQDESLRLLVPGKILQLLNDKEGHMRVHKISRQYLHYLVGEETMVKDHTMSKYKENLNKVDSYFEETKFCGMIEDYLY
eukprot:NODE_2576_length_1546_cov_33.431483_g2219_i0.p1 GENE.NODE_2576_length_1546_cov_33.431483_g2219_i0~~NODE_2576_length_1546_cov_33.431483_g2219_i0.p1  ORF type:complete len:441 (+),score=52.39 NODE_2576_length_1546_cov_33.431483_g2219_i0:78-1400(+)